MKTRMCAQDRLMFNRWLLTAIMMVLFMCQSHAGEWSQWEKAKGWRGLDYRMKMEGYNSDAHKYSWFVQFRNRYESPIHFGFHAGPRDGSHPLNDRLDINSGRTSDFWGLFLEGTSQELGVWIGKMRIGESDTGAYAAEDDDTR